jgi:uncharacterized iron-regulated membrane protein
MTSGKTRHINLRRLLRTIHLWIGVSLGIPLALIGATGAILTYEHEIVAFFDGASEPQLATGTPQPVSAIVEAARAKAPEGTQPMSLSMPGGDEPAMVRFARPGRTAPGPGGATVVRIDPVSLAVFDPQQRSTTQQWLRQAFMLHANLMGGRDGRYWVGWFGVAMCILGVSGIVMWWPRPRRWKQAFRVSKGAHGIQLNRELHGVVGIWGLVVFLVISFSGVYIVFPQTTGGIVRTIFPGRDLRGEASSLRVTPVPNGTRMTADEAVDLARGIAPDTALRLVSFPQRPDQPYRVAFELPGTTPGHGVPTITAFVDPWTHSIIARQDPRDYTPGETITAWQRALHGGAGQGWVWQLLTFISGLMPVLFAITGIAMWWMRRRHKKKAQAAPANSRTAASPAE